MTNQRVKNKIWNFSQVELRCSKHMANLTFFTWKLTNQCWLNFYDSISSIITTCIEVIESSTKLIVLERVNEKKKFSNTSKWTWTCEYLTCWQRREKRIIIFALEFTEIKSTSFKWTMCKYSLAYFHELIR